MIFFVYNSKLCVATLIFYTCIYYPFLQAKRSLLTILGFFLCLYHHPLERSDADQYDELSNEATNSCSVDLHMERYGDLKHDGSDCDEACSVCLAEFEGEDYVSKLSKCGHVFHINCIQKWVDKNQFTCPLCRSVLLHF